MARAIDFLMTGCDAAGRVLLAVNDEFCTYEAVAAVLPALIASGAVEEIDAAAYQPVRPDRLDDGGSDDE